MLELGRVIVLDESMTTWAVDANSRTRATTSVHTAGENTFAFKISCWTRKFES